MHLTILYAHTGDAVSVDSSNFHSVEELKGWIAEQTKVSVQNQILTTVKGALVKQQALITEKELFLYSRQYITPSSSVAPPTFPFPNLSKPPPPPDRLDNQNDIASWRSLFTNRVAWANSILSLANALVATIDNTNKSIVVINRSLEAAVTNLDHHVRTSGQKYDELRSWAFEVLEGQEKLLRGWEPALEKLSRIPIHKEVAKVVATEHQKNGRQPKITSTLLDIISLSDVRQSGKDLDIVARDFHTKVQGLGNTLESIRQQAEGLSTDIQRGWKRNEDPSSDEAQSLLSDVRTLVQKIQQDQAHISSYPNSSKSIPSVSQIAHTHTKDYLPNLVEFVTELGALVQAAVQRKNASAQFTIQSLQAISRLEQKLYQDLVPAVKKSEVEYEERSTPSYQLLTLVVHLPAIYGSFLVECVRRREWNEKMGQDGAKLAEELAGLKEEEEKRRKKWYKVTTQSGELPISFLPIEGLSGSINVEVNFHAETGGWPAVQRSELDVLLNALKQMDGSDSLVRDLAQQIIDLDKPSRRQRKATTPTLATRAFKMGSIHEAAMTSSSFIANGDEATQIQRLRDDRARLEERARMYESRVRKLEDLLHRQRPGNAIGVQFGHNNSSTTVGSPLSAEPMSRNSSQGTITTPMQLHNRRTSIGDGPEKALAIRIVTLENDLALEKEARQKLQQEADSRAQSEKDWAERMTEADQTKRDLLANIQAQQQEFNTERKELQDKVTDMEEQLEGWRQRVDEVYAELDRMEESKAMEAQRTHTLGKEMEDVHGQMEDYKRLLSEHEQKMNSMLSENDQLRVAAERAADQYRKELEATKSSEAQKAQAITDLQAKLSARDKAHSFAVADYERKIRELEAALEAKDNESKKVASKLDKADKELDTVRSRISDVLVQSIRDSQQELTRTTILDVDELMARLEGFVSDLRHGISAEQNKVMAITERNRQLQSRLEGRTVKAKDLTQKLYTHNARSGQLLESLGFKVIIDEDGQTQIVRLSRSNATADSELAKSISMSASLPLLSASADTIKERSAKDVALLYWTETSDSETESEKYAAFLNSIGTFDLDAFGDAVTRRVREAEHMARKWQKQCRDYRDKYHRAQAEAGEKIAYRSFKEGDLALFLPTRNQVTRPWAAFNVGAPHYFLREQEGHRLRARDWLLARITKVEQRVVDLSKSSAVSAAATAGSIGDRASSVSSEGAASIDEDNPFQLSDGLRWYLLDAVEEGKLGAPGTPGLGGGTVAAANVDAKGSIRASKKSAATGARKTLTKSLAQSGGPPAGGETSSIRSRESVQSAGGRKGSGNSANSQVARPTPPITSVPEGSAIEEGRGE
ncbi:oligomeric, coiled-coil, peripheral membrane protein [Orbilia brochopaga]|uniref:Autophagy-related protein 11 n=1 Tax=Orbilia brochopaga TaxID=3140254 RepID=A0AAV9V7H2_9PEZI